MNPPPASVMASDLAAHLAYDPMPDVRGRWGEYTSCTCGATLDHGAVVGQEKDLSEGERTVELVSAVCSFVELHARCKEGRNRCGLG